MRARVLSDEAVVAEGPLVELADADVAELKRAAREAPRGRMRVCTHPDADDRLHEMVIVHPGGAYVRPHKHVGKSESMHVVEGRADVVFFDDDGDVDTVVPLAPYGSSERFYFRVDAPWYHTLLIRSDVFVFHEVTNGPFRRDETVFAPWSPDPEDEAACARFLNELALQLEARS